MPSKPLLSFLLISTDDDATADAALRSCLTQSLSSVDVIHARAASAASADLDLAADSRVREIELPSGASRAELLRAAIGETTTAYVLVVDSGDELRADAAAQLTRQVEESTPDLVGFGTATGRTGAQATWPTAGRTSKSGADVLRDLVARDRVADLTPSRVLFRTELLRQGFDAAPTDPVDERVVVLRAYLVAETYASLDTIVRDRTPTVAPDVEPIDAFHRAVDAAAAMGSIEQAVRDRARSSADPEPIVDAYRAGYLTAVAEALAVFGELTPAERIDEQGVLQQGLDALDAVCAAVTLAPDTLPMLATYGARRDLADAAGRSVLLTTNVLTTGGVSGVLLTQARLLLAAGHRVTIATHRPGSAEHLVPEGATLVQLGGATKAQRAAQWAWLCRRHEVDIVIDHRILYSRDWPMFALAARAAGAATIGWIHNFAARPTYNGNDLQTLLATHLDALAHLIVLSPLDVAFWKLRGIRHVSYLPNPPSPFLLTVGANSRGKAAPVRRPAELVWWGRLEEHTKQVTQLVEVAAALQKLGVDFRMRIVGPGWAGMTPERLHELAAKRGVADRVVAIGPQHGADLLEVIDSSDVFVNTSIIEGYPLTLPEAQSRGLPIAMYDLPWLSLIHDNPGVITTPQQDPEALASAIADLLADPGRYEAMSRCSIDAAARATSFDFAQLYEQLMRDELPPEYSPQPTLDDGRRILELLIFFAEHSTPPPRVSTGRISRNTATRRRRRRRPRTLAARLERKLTPLGHRLIDAAPWLRPIASEVKSMLLRRS